MTEHVTYFDFKHKDHTQEEIVPQDSRLWLITEKTTNNCVLAKTPTTTRRTRVPCTIYDVLKENSRRYIENSTKKALS